MRPRLPQSILLCLVWMLSTFAASAQEVSVAAKVSDTTTEVGEPVQFQIEVSGATSGVEPADVKVDGMEVQYAGPQSSRSIQITNGRMTSEMKTIFSYQLTPTREGQFTIPAQFLVVDGRPYKTQPIVLKVQKGDDPGNPQGNGERAFAEIVTDKHTAYVGETFPVELNLYIDRSARVGDMNMPTLGEGSYTAPKFPQPRQTIKQRNGRDYTVYTFQTTVTPTKGGKLTLGPSEITFIAQMPLPGNRQAQRRRRNDPFGMLDDFLNFGTNLGQVAKYTVKAAGFDIEVKTPPTEGRPKGFSGAIGQFEFEAEGSPAQVKIGEPVNMKLTVSGEGSFDRMKAPVMEDPTGWKAYDASEQFISGDEKKNAGSKVFTIPVVPEEKQQWMPRYQFSYFDPVKEQYVTLRARPEPLVVIGEPMVAPTPTPEVKTAASPQTPPPGGGKSGLAGLQYEEGPRATFAPVHRRTGFWVANGALGMVVFGSLARRWLRRSPTATRQAGLRRERDELWSKVRARQDNFYEQAVRLAQVQTALVKGGDAASIDAGVARQAAKNEEVAAGIAAIFETRGERLYAGAGTVPAEVSAEEQERVIQILKEFCQ